MMFEQRRIQTILVIGMAISALIGAIGGAIMGAFFSSRISVLPELTNERVDQKIVELIEEESASIAVVERVTPAVVSLVLKKPRSPFIPTPLDTEPLVEVSSGSGFFVSQDGFVLTNRHVIDDENVQYFVVTSEGEEFSAQLIDIDPFQDMAILKVQGEGFPVATLGDSDQIRIGQTVIAIGNTLSEFPNTVTKGVISGINRRVTAGFAATAEVIEQAIQTDAAINPGNSGGPLINLRGEVIGINTAVSMQGEAIAFAIPINQAKRAVQDVRELGRIVKPWLGIRYMPVVQDPKLDQRIPYEMGAMIVAGNQPGQPGIIPGSPAQSAGLKEGDVIITINGKFLSKENSISDLISHLRPGDVIELEVLREGERRKFTVTLAEYGD